MIKEQIWQFFYRRWNPYKGPRKEGYTALLMVPGDLPIFLRLALDVISSQNREHLFEALVIPDRITPSFRKLWHNLHDTLDFPLRLSSMRSIDRFFIRLFNNPGHIHWLQHVRGISATKTTHALIHDADLFLTDPHFLKKHFETCAQKKVACMGVSPVWDGWFQTQGIDYLAATWEMMAEVEWFLEFAPWQHRGHESVFKGQKHVFDTTLLPQCYTAKERIARHEEFQDFIHFNYVISTFRWFQRSKGPFVDEHFRLLLIRLLLDAYDMDDKAVPSIATLVQGLKSTVSPVCYMPSLQGNYEEFRGKLDKLLASELFDPPKKGSIIENLAPFDAVYSSMSRSTSSRR